MATHHLALGLAGIALLLGGFLAGQLVMAPEERVVDLPGSSSATATRSPARSDPALRKALDALTAELARLRRALPRRLEPAQNDASPATVIDERLIRALETLASGRVADRLVTNAPPPLGQSLPQPELRWDPEAWRRLNELGKQKTHRAHHLWTFADLVARYGPPHEIQPRSNSCIDVYYTGPLGPGQEERTLRFTLWNDRVIRAYAHQ